MLASGVGIQGAHSEGVCPAGEDSVGEERPGPRKQWRASAAAEQGGSGTGGRWHSSWIRRDSPSLPHGTGRSVSQQQGSLLLKVLGPRPLLRKHGEEGIPASAERLTVLSVNKYEGDRQCR